MYGTYQHPGHQPRQPIYGGHQPPYSHQSPLENYGQIHAAYGIPPFQSVTGFPQATTATYNSTLPHQAHISASLSAPAAFAWKSATAADGQIYYYNEKTGETQWDKPAGMP
jgi:WW domain